MSTQKLDYKCYQCDKLMNETDAFQHSKKECNHRIEYVVGKDADNNKPDTYETLKIKYDALLSTISSLRAELEKEMGSCHIVRMERDLLLAQAEALAEVLSHAKTIGRLGEGSTLGWANEVLSSWQKFKEQK